MFVHHYEHVLDLVSVTLDATSVCTFTMTGHNLSVGDTFFVDPYYDPTWTFGGLSVQHLVGAHEVTDVVNGTQVKALLSVCATATGADLLNPHAKVAVDRYLAFDLCDPASGWVYTVGAPPTASHTNTASQLHLT